MGVALLFSVCLACIGESSDPVGGSAIAKTFRGTTRRDPPDGELEKVGMACASWTAYFLMMSPFERIFSEQ